MGYVVHSLFAEELKPLGLRMGRRVWRWLAPPILALCHTGELVAGSSIQMMLVSGWVRFRNESPDAPWWPGAFIVAVTVGATMMFGIWVYRSLRARVVQVDGLAFLAGSGLATAYCLWLVL